MVTILSVVSQKQNINAMALSSKLDNAFARKQAYINFTGAIFAAKNLDSVGLYTSFERSVFKFGKIYTDFELVDIYCNLHMLYVLTAYETEYVKIPLIHQKYDIMPEAYIVVDLESGMKSGKIMGVIYPRNLQSAEIDGRNYRFNINNLQSSDDLVKKLKKTTGIKSSVGRHLDCISLFASYIEDKLNEDGKIKLIRHILTCETCKKRLLRVIELKIEEKDMKNYKNIPSVENSSALETPPNDLQNKPAEKDMCVKGAIDIIYKDKIEDLKPEVFKFYQDVPARVKRLALVAAGIALVLGILTVFAFNIPQKNIEKPVSESAYTENQTAYEDSTGNFDILIPQIKRGDGYITVSKVSWEVSSEVSGDDQKKFLQSAGKNIRLNLQNDLLLSNETVVNGKVKFDMTFMKDGSLDSITVVQGSGSGAVDLIIKQSIENTLRYMHPPKSSFVGKKNSITLAVEF